MPRARWTYCCCATACAACNRTGRCTRTLTATPRRQTHRERAWATTAGEHVFGQHPKYDEEYTCAMKTCGFGPNISASLYRKYDRCSAALLQLEAQTNAEAPS